MEIGVAFYFLKLEVIQINDRACWFNDRRDKTCYACKMDANETLEMTQGCPTF